MGRSSSRTIALAIHLEESKLRLQTHRRELGVSLNVHTMNQPGKLECITREASRLKLDVLGLSEVRWKNSGRCTTDEHVMIYSGHKTEHKHGLGVLLSKQVAKSMIGFHALSDIILIVKIASKPFNLVIVQVYAPTSNSPEDDIEKFYDDLDAAYKLCGTKK